METKTEIHIESETELENENETEFVIPQPPVFPLTDSQNIFTPTESIHCIVNRKAEIMDNACKIDRNTNETKAQSFNNLISQTDFILKKSVSEAIEFAEIVKKNKHLYPEQVKKDAYETLTNIKNYIERTAVNFIVFGYPCEKLIEIGRIIANKLHYIHIYPNKLINKEIYKRSSIGLWIYKNIKYGKKIPIDVLEVLFKREMCRDIYKDHGYVVSGFPVIPNFEIDDALMPQDCFDGQSVEIDIDEFPHKIKNESDLVEETDDDVISLDDSINSEEFNVNEQNEKAQSECSESGSELGDLQESEEDHFYFSGIEDCDENEILELDENIMKFVRSVKFKVPHNVNNSIILSYESQLKIIKDLHDLPSAVVYIGNDENLDINIELEQDIDIGLKNFQIILPLIDYFIGCYSSERILLIDGRLRIDLISEYIDKRLLYLQRKEFYKPEVLFPNEYIPKYFRKYLSNDQECDYDVLRNTNCIEPKYKWFCYGKKHYCPVKAYEGKLTIGLIKYSIRFLGRIFMCSSKYSMKKFIKHPQTYLIHKHNCRIAILAPPKFGTSVLARTFKGCFESAGIYETRKIVFHNAINQNDAYHEAHRLAMTESSEILKQRYDYYNQLKVDKIDEFTKNPLTILMNLINDVNKIVNQDNGIFCVIDSFKEVLLDEIFLKEIFPLPCFEDLIDTSFNSALTQLLFEENIYEIYTQDLVKNKQLAQNFIDWLLARKKKIKQPNIKQYDQWILDGPPVDIQFWKLLAKRNALPDYVILPKCVSLKKLENVYTTYKQKFRYYQIFISELLELYPNTFSFNVDVAESIKFCIPKNSDLMEIQKYARSIAQFRIEKINTYLENVKLLKNFLTNKKILIIEVNYSDKELNVNIFKVLREYFISVKPKILTLKSLKEHLAKTYILNNSIEYNENEEIGSVESNEEYFSEEQQDEESNSCNDEADNIDLSEYYLGPTDKYCPVCVRDHLLLQKGFAKFCCEYRNHIISFSSQLCLNKYCESPERYFYEKQAPVVPPPKFCIIGPNHVNSMILARLIKQKFDISIKATINFTSNVEIDILLDDSKSTIGESLEESFKYLQHKNKGLVIAGFPVQENHIDIMVENNFYPEAAFLIDDKEQMFNNLIGHLMKLSVEFHLITKSDTSYIRTKSEYLLKNIVETEKKLVQKLEKLNIPIIKVQKHILQNAKSFDALCDRINNNRLRHALFANTHLISMTTAERLIEQGYCTMSRFQRACPVLVSELNCLCNYEGMLKQNKIFPCLYRLKVYFISGKERLKKFTSNPQNYVAICSPFPLSKPIIALVKGASNSGVTSLCRRISKEYGMNIFREQDIKEFIKTELPGTRISAELERNNGVLNPYLLRISLGILKNSSAAGIILDNLPITPYLLTETAKYGVSIHATYFIEMDFSDICKIFTKQHPTKDLSEVARDYEHYKKVIMEFYTNKQVQFFNINKLNATKNQWHVWDACQHSLIKTARNILAYKFLLPKTNRSCLKHLNIFYEEVFSKLDEPPFYCYMCIRETERQVAYRYDWNNVGERFYTSDCQLELIKPLGYMQKWLYDVYKFPKPYEFNEKVKPLLTNNDFRNNFIQVRNKIYWTCDTHSTQILAEISKFIPLDEKHMPQYYPMLVQNYPRTMMAHDGYCIVSYDLAKKTDVDKKKFLLLHYIANLGQMSFETDTLTNYYIQGNRELAIYYRGNIYLNANEGTCLEFLQQPEYYYNIPFLSLPDENIDQDYESGNLTIENLKPEILIKGLKALNTLRPKHFALTFQESAAVYLGLFIKKYMAVEKVKKDFYKDLIDQFEKECTAATKKIRQYKMAANPFIQRTNEEDNNGDNSETTLDMDSLLEKFKCVCARDIEHQPCK